MESACKLALETLSHFVSRGLVSLCDEKCLQLNDKGIPHIKLQAVSTTSPQEFNAVIYEFSVCIAFLELLKEKREEKTTAVTSDLESLSTVGVSQHDITEALKSFRNIKDIGERIVAHILPTESVLSHAQV